VYTCVCITCVPSYLLVGGNYLVVVFVAFAVVALVVLATYVYVSKVE
jgi:hypothetical protein